MLTQYLWVVFALSAAMVWGLDYALSEKILRDQFSPISLMLIQMIVGVVIFSIIEICGHHKEDWKLLASNHKLLALVIFVTATFNIGNLLIFFAIKEKNASLAGLMELSYPLFTIFFTWLIFRINYLTPSVLIGSVLIFSGVIVLTVF